MLLRKTPKEKIKEIVEIFDLESIKNKDKIKNMIKTQTTISAFAKHLPKK
ncbi:unnamed protein product [marine sediment metagenome]|uniref:Uncharacterized protein n=1 Tax=marine sediment metagenome TaxID=412755 RepID=X1JD99_9ZZZZ